MTRWPKRIKVWIHFEGLKFKTGAWTTDGVRLVADDERVYVLETKPKKRKRRKAGEVMAITDISEAFRKADETGEPQEVLGDDGKRVMLIVCPKDRRPMPGDESQHDVAKIVAWLRRRAPHHGINDWMSIADAIERGEWKR